MRWQSHLRCRLWSEHDHLCTHPLTSGWWIQTAPNPFIGVMRHAAPRTSLLTRLKAWFTWKTFSALTRGARTSQTGNPPSESPDQDG